MTRRSVLFLDIGSHCGWAVHEGGKIVFGTYHSNRGKFEGAGMRYLRFEREFLNRLTKVKEVYFEEVRRHEGTDAAHVYGGLTAVLMAWCERHSIPYKGIPVGTLKKHGTGKGNCNKEAMIAAARKLGFAPEDDNQADALIGLDYVLKTDTV